MPLIIEIVTIMLIIGVLFLQLKNSKKRKLNSVKEDIHEQMDTIDQIHEIKDLEAKLEEKKKKLFENKSTT